MRLRISHNIALAFDAPKRGLLQLLRLTPRSFEGLHVLDWRIDVDADCMLRNSEDAFGNLVHSFSLDQPAGTLAIHAGGEVDTFDVAGIVRGAPERFPPELFLRDTPATLADAAVAALARDCAGGEPLETLHALMDRVHADVALHDSPAGRTAGAVLADKQGTSGDMAHVFIAAARHLGRPARYIAGYALPEDGDAQLGGWAEVHAGALGWIGFDPSIARCPEERHVRLACGLDAEGAAVLRGNHAGVATDVVRLRQAYGQRQS